MGRDWMGRKETHNKQNKQNGASVPSVCSTAAGAIDRKVSHNVLKSASGQTHQVSG